MLPISSPFPLIPNPITLRASALLPAAGAWDATPLEIACAGYRRALIYVAYTRGAAGGAADLKIEYSPRAVNAVGVMNWFQMSTSLPAAVAAGVDTQTRTQRGHTTYQATGAAAEGFVLGPFEIEAVERMRITARESGAAGNPGTLHIVGVLMV